MQTAQRTIGVFDSGFGGLTVLRALLARLPDARYIYLGDTARLPYGSKSQQTIARYAVSSAKFLFEQGATQLVIACNTASALALDELKAELPIPVTGVIAPGAQAAKDISVAERPSIASGNRAFSGHVLVLATAATVQSRAYTQALHALGLAATEKACPLLVPMVEEGWTDHPVTAEVLRIYLAEAFREAPQATTLLLGCTHYPLLKPLIERTLLELDHPLQIIDSAQATAESVAATLPDSFKGDHPTETDCSFYATDSIEKFQRLGAHFLGRELKQVNLLDLGG